MKILDYVKVRTSIQSWIFGAIPNLHQFWEIILFRTSLFWGTFEFGKVLQCVGMRYSVWVIDGFCYAKVRPKNLYPCLK